MHSYYTQTHIEMPLSTKYTVRVMKTSSVKTLCPNSYSVCFGVVFSANEKKHTLILPSAGKPLGLLGLIRNINALISPYFCTTRRSSTGFNNY